LIFFFQAEDGIRDFHVTGVQTCALPIYTPAAIPPKKKAFNSCLVLKKVKNSMLKKYSISILNTKCNKPSCRKMYVANCQMRKLKILKSLNNANCDNRPVYKLPFTTRKNIIKQLIILMPIISLISMDVFFILNVLIDACFKMQSNYNFLLNSNGIDQTDFSSISTSIKSLQLLRQCAQNEQFLYRRRQRMKNRQNLKLNLIPKYLEQNISL